MTPLQSLFDAERWPIVSGIYFDSSEVVLIEGELEHWVHPIAHSTLASIVELNQEWMTSLTTLFETEDPRVGVRVMCGEGAHGSEGFVAMSRLEGRLAWVAYFRWSNPFMKATIKDGRVIATTNLGHSWSFPIDHAEQVQVDWEVSAAFWGSSET
jgi:hypothetical protein